MACRLWIEAPMSELILHPKPLTAAAFAPFGDVIAMADHEATWINEGTSQRYNDLAELDVQAAGGRPLISIFHALPRPLPLPVEIIERHPLSSQAFYPLERRAFLVVVAEEGPAPMAQRVRAFLSSGDQGVNYRRNTWHHALIALGQPCDFLVIDRGGPETNCEELRLSGERVLVALA
jgi:ureidoglycolate lyase